MIEVTIKEDPEKPRKTAQNTPFPNGKTLKKEKTGREASQKYRNTRPTIISKQPSAHFSKHKERSFLAYI